MWEATPRADGVTFSLLSPDGDEGFPGAVLAQVTYRLTADSRLLINYQAVSTKPTPINIVNHSYFNLAGHVSVCFSPPSRPPSCSRLTFNIFAICLMPTGRRLAGGVPNPARRQRGPLHSSGPVPDPDR